MKKVLLLATSSILAVPFSFVLAPVAASAQQITTEISGQVTDESGSPLGNATVTITDTRTGSSQNFTTNAEGLFNAQNLATGGPYTVTAVAEGHQGQTVEQLFTNLQGATQLTFALSKVSAEATSDTIVVTAQRARVTQLEVGPGTSFNTEVMAAAPTFNRDVRDVIRIDPRVSLDRDDGGSGTDRVSCLGGNDRGNAFTVDGTLQGDIYGLNDTGFSSRSSTPIPYDAVRETQVQFAPFDVEYGQFTGCAINVVTKSGSNRFRGEAFYEFSNNGLRGNRVADRPVGDIEPEERWGIALGGPIIKDRLFFFGAYEKQTAGAPQDDGPVGGGYANETLGITVDQFNAISDTLRDVYGIDTGPLVQSRPFSNERLFGRLDWQINDDHRLEATYQRLEESTVRSDDFFLGSSPQVTGLNTFYISGTESDYYSGRLYSRWTDRLSTEIRYSRSEIQDLQDPVGGGEAQSGNPIPRIIVGVDNPPLGSAPVGQTPPDGAILAGPGTSRSANDLRTKVDQFRALANYDAGSHRLKFGFEFNRANIFNLFVQNATGTLVFRNLADLQAGLLSPGTGNNETRTQGFRVTTGQTEGGFGNFSETGDVLDAAAEFTRSIYSLYAQDDWRVNDRLEFVLGARLDWYDGDKPELNPNFLERYGFGNDVGFDALDPVLMPRLAMRYDIGDWNFLSNARLQGGIGIFSGGDPVVWFGNAFQNNGYIAQGTTQGGTCPAGQIDVVVGGVFTGLPQCLIDNGVTEAARGLGDTQSIDPAIKMPTVLRINAGFQTGLNFTPTGFFSDWRLNLDYIYSRYRDPFTIVDLAQTIDFRAGNSGRTIDGRPIYASIDPTVAGCNAELVSVGPAPLWSNVTTACFATQRDDELMLTNANGYDSHIASAILSKNFTSGIFTPEGSSYFSLGYAWTQSHDKRNMYNSTATSNYDLTAASDRQNPDTSRGFFESRHNISFSATFREKFFRDLATSLGFTFIARSGRPYSLTFGGGGVFGDSVSGDNNALLYIPTGVTDPNISPTSNMAAVEALSNFARGLDCAENYVGRTIKRNTCTNNWYFDLDLRFSQELPGPASLAGINGIEDKITAYVMFDNFLNLLDKDWNVQRRRNFAGLQDVASISGVDSQGRYIITGFNGEADFKADNGINVSSSVWRIKAGVSYKF
jgi:hypothetical protein